MFLAGKTNSTSGIAANGSQLAFGGYDDAFLVKFNSNGNRIWGTYYGGNLAEYARSCSADANGNIYLSGGTASANNISSNGFQNTLSGFTDAFLVKFNASGIRLWGTYYGGTGTEEATSCCTDNAGFVYLAGNTSSDGIAYQGFKNTRDGSADNFLAKLTDNGTRVWATYYGGESYESSGLCCTDPFGNVYLAGSTPSFTNIAYNGFRNTNAGGVDFYLVKFSGSCNRQWATYYGGNGEEQSPSITGDAAGNIYLGGTTFSTTGIYLNGLPNYNLQTGSYDACIAKFEGNGNCLWSTYYGGSDLDIGNSCAADNIGNVYLSGQTGTSGLSINGFQNNFTGNPYTSFLLKIGAEPLCINATQPIITATPDTICAGSSATLTIASGSLNSAATWQWRKDSCTGATVGTGTSITVSPTATTTYFVRGEGGCVAPGNCTSKTIVVNPVPTATVSLTANPIGPIVAGTPVTFAAAGTNGGTAPIYTFKVNSTTVQNGSGNTYTSSTLQNGDVVSVVLTSNALCTTNPTVTSNAITMVVAAPCIAPTTPTITTNYDTVCTGATPTLTVATGNLNSATHWHWQWYTGSCGGTPIGNTSSITVTPAATTIYYLRGEGSCITPGPCVSKTIYVKPAPVATFTTAPAAICAGDTLVVTFTGLAPSDATYNWIWGGGRVISGAGVGPYRVAYTTSASIGLTVSNGTCSVAATAQAINPAPLPEVALSISDSVGCTPQLIKFSAAMHNGSSWMWDFGDGAILSNVSSPVEHIYASGTYTPSLTVFQGNCSNRATKTIRIYQRPTAAFSVQPGPNTPVPLSQANFVFFNASQGASRYLWQFGDMESSTLANPVHRYAAPGTYAVSLYAYSSGNCADTFEVKPLLIKTDTIAAFTIPTAFSPNGDGINDTWMVAALQQPSNCRVSIYNRWGQTVFASTGYPKPWDGKYDGKPLPVDTYYYVITLENKSYTGSVMLLR